jgi:hypothetical protein
MEPEHSRLHSILMNGVVVHDYQTGVRRRVVKVLCNKADTEMLRAATGVADNNHLEKL